MVYMIIVSKSTILMDKIQGLHQLEIKKGKEHLDVSINKKCKNIVFLIKRRTFEKRIQ